LEKEKTALPAVEIDCPPCFDLDQIFGCGQAFRFEKCPDGSYIGVAFSRVLKVRKIKGKLQLFNTTPEEYERLWREYFDLDRDYERIRRHFAKDGVMRKAMTAGGGIRLLRQEPWETLVTFILSQCNNIPRIQKIIRALCEGFGEPISFEGRIYYTFPSPGRIAALSAQELASLRCGYRAAYIKEAAEKVASGELDLKKIADMDTQEARKALLSLKGVGDKVADCVLLFGFARLDAFPVDVWIGRVIGTLYDKNTFRKEVFGQYCGIAQQYLFYYARETKLRK